jgi:hypothetical protein
MQTLDRLTRAQATAKVSQLTPQGRAAIPGLEDENPAAAIPDQNFGPVRRDPLMAGEIADKFA